jgi:hypothetical protein
VLRGWPVIEDNLSKERLLRFSVDATMEQSDRISEVARCSPGAHPPEFRVFIFKVISVMFDRMFPRAWDFTNA